MNNYLKPSVIQTTLVRLFAVALVGAGVWFGSDALAQQLHYNASEPLRAGLALLGAVVTWFVASRALAFTADALDVPKAVAPALKSSKPEDRLLPAKLQPALAVANKLPESGQLVKTSKLTIETSPNSDGTLKVVVTATMTNSQFKGNQGLLVALQATKGSTWAKHTNLGEGTKRVEGFVAATADRQKTLAHLKSLGERFS